MFEHLRYELDVNAHWHLGQQSRCFVQTCGHSSGEEHRRWRRHYALVTRAGLPSGAFSCISFLIVGLLQQSISGTAHVADLSIWVTIGFNTGVVASIAQALPLWNRFRVRGPLYRSGTSPG